MAATFELPRFYPILDPSLRPDLMLEELVRPLVEAGVQLSQLRMKGALGGELSDAVRRMRDAAGKDVRLVVNDRADVAHAMGVAGVHLGQDDLPPADARAMLGDRAIIGYSTHAEDQVREAMALTEVRLDYLAIGPIFPTGTKQNADTVVGLEGLRRIREIYSGPLVAIGGIGVGNAAQVIDNGADSVAVISAWMIADDIPERLNMFRKVLARSD